MGSWHYKTVTYHSDIECKSLDDFLNGYAKRGWRVVNLRHIGRAGSIVEVLLEIWK